MADPWWEQARRATESTRSPILGGPTGQSTQAPWLSGATGPSASGRLPLTGRVGSVNSGGFGAGRTAGSTAPAGPYDFSGSVIGEILAGLGGAWNTPGSGGGMVSQAALRNALQGAYGQSEGDRSNVYGQVDQEIEGRAGDITAGYTNASQSLQQNAIQRALAMREASAARTQDDLRAAQLFGFEGIAPSANAGANQVMEENIGAQQGIADAWSGFYGAGNQTALERNEAVGDAFTHMGLQQQLALQAMLNDAMLQAGDYWVGGSGGSSLSPNQILRGYNDLLDYSVADTRNDIATAKLPARGKLLSTGKAQ